MRYYALSLAFRYTHLTLMFKAMLPPWSLPPKPSHLNQVHVENRSFAHSPKGFSLLPAGRETPGLKLDKV